MNDLEQTLGVTLGVEGGLSDHWDDPGGLTRYGVTRGTYRRAVRLGVIEPNPKGVAGITVEQAKTVYREMYAKPVRFDELPRGLNALIFDFQVNSGQGGRRLQKALNYLVGAKALGVDNNVGNTTVKVVNAFCERHPENVYRLMDEAAARRFIHWTDLLNWRSFKWGWARRHEKVKTHAVRMACGDV